MACVPQQSPDQDRAQCGPCPQHGICCSPILRESSHKSNEAETNFVLYQNEMSKDSTHTHTHTHTCTYNCPKGEVGIGCLGDIGGYSHGGCRHEVGDGPALVGRGRERQLAEVCAWGIGRQQHSTTLQQSVHAGCF